MWIKDLRRTLAVGLAILMAMTTVPAGLAQAKMVTTDQVIEQSASSQDRAQVLDFLMREDVQQQLTLLGVDPDEAAERVAGLSDEELRQIAGQLDELPAGEGSVGIVVGAILIIFLVLLITDLLGLTDVFPFVKK
ncbi:MAG: PA2779 family protein [Kiloniellales bacterium]|nr:PA2779 family protein [Kiloniellales bacterium]